MKLTKIATLIFFGLQVIACSNNTQKELGKPTTPSATTGTNEFPKIDTSKLKDEASILNALTQVLEARAAEEKKSAADPSFQNHYAEYATSYALILSAATTHMDTYKDPLKGVAFYDKVSAIEKKFETKK